MSIWWFCSAVSIDKSVDAWLRNFNVCNGLTKLCDLHRREDVNLLLVAQGAEDAIVQARISLHALGVVLAVFLVVCKSEMRSFCGRSRFCGCFWGSKC